METRDRLSWRARQPTSSPAGATCRRGCSRSSRPLPLDSLGSCIVCVCATSAKRRRPILARAQDEGWDHAQVLKVLLAEEAAGRDRSTRELHRREARLPSGKTFEAWDPKASAIPDDAQWALRSLDWMGRAENLVLVGPSGTGKSHFAEAIAHAAIDRDLRVSWFTLESLTATIARSRIDASTGKVVERIVRSELVVVDDIGLLPAGAEEAEALYRLVDAAYEKRSSDRDLEPASGAV